MKIVEDAYKLAEGPLLKQIRVQRHAMIPITAKISVVTKNPISVVPDPATMVGGNERLQIQGRRRRELKQKRCKQNFRDQ